VAIAVATITGAFLTYRALDVESNASDHDAQAVAEALQVYEVDTTSTTRAHIYNGYASVFRNLLAEAEAVRETDPERANLLESIAYTYAGSASIWEFVRSNPDGSYDSTSTFDLKLQQQAIEFAFASPTRLPGSPTANTPWAAISG
jgi:hypothetical protein